jgi:hypothetical protein
MKKLFTTFSLAVAVVGLSFSQDVIVKPTKVISINKAIGAITLDGDDSEASWTSATEVPIDSGDVTNSEGFAASFKAIWDDNYIYLFVYAKDVNPFEYDGTDSWKKDGIQSYWDVRDSLVVNAKRAWQHTVAYCYGMTHATMDVLSDFPFYNDSTLATYADLGTALTVDGWNIEARIPITSLYYNADDVTDYETCLAVRTIKANDTVGFAIQANNYNATIGVPDRTAVLTYPGGANTYQYSNTWGGLKLLDAVSSIHTVSTSLIKIYPNPIIDNLKIDMDGLNSVEIIDLAGKIVLQQKSSSNSLTINLSELNAGLYFVRANGNNNTIQKIIKR